jgi:hypothetical protein
MLANLQSNERETEGLKRRGITEFTLRNSVSLGCLSSWGNPSRVL